MVLQWATKRLCKFFLKRLNRFLNEEIDVEQLDVQLGNGTGTLTELVLNVDYVNDQIKSLPVILKYGSIARIVVRLPSDIEVDGLELLVAPRQSGESRPGLSTNVGGSCSGIQQPGISISDTGVPTYLGVSDGVRIIGQMIKNLLLGLRVNINNVTVGIEGNSGSESYVTLQMPSLKYGYEAANDDEPSNLVKVIEFEKATVDVGTQKKVRLLEKNGLSGSIQVTLPCKEVAALASPKIEFDICVEPVQLRASVEGVNHLVSVAHSYVTSSVAAEQGSVYHDTSSFYESDQGQRSSMFDARSKCSDSFSSTSKSTLSVIADWMRKPEFSEPDLAASMDEFFECFDAWNQSATSSGIWNWTRSAFGAASVSDMAGTSQDIQMECAITARFPSLSATLLYDHGSDGLDLVLKNATLNALLSREGSRLDADVMLVEATRLCPSAMEKQFFDRMSQLLLPSFPISLHGSRGLKILKVASSPGNPAGRLAIKKYHRSGSGSASFVRTKVSLVLQPVILWADVDTLNKLVQTLDRVHGSSDSSSREDEDVGNSAGSDCKVNLSVLSVRTFVSSASRGKPGCFLALDVGVTSGREAQTFSYEHQTGSTGDRQSITLTVTDGMLYTISSSTYTEVVRLRSDSQGKACVNIKWTENHKTGPWIARKIWDGIAATKKKHSSHNFDYASATALGSDSTSATVELLTATSSSNVHISLPRLLFTLSDQPAVFELLACLTSSEPDASSCARQGSQTVLTLEVREVQAIVNVSRFVETPSNGIRMVDFLQLRSSRLKLVAGVALGGDAGACYLNINLGEGEIRERTRNTELVCWKASAIGRGDGGVQNALSRGAAGLSMHLVSWPGNGREPDVLLTGCMRGATIFTEGGNFDWLPAVVKFLEECKGPFRTVDCDQPVQPSRRPYFLFDLHDVALCYEPVGPSSIACALAAAALRVSSGETTNNDAEEYCISFRDLGLHLVDTKLRGPGDVGGASLQLRGYVQVAKSPVVGSLVKLNSTEDPSYELISADNQLNFDTCPDTTAAFGRLVADLQQLFAPDLQQTVELQLRTMKGKSTENVSSTSDEREQTLHSADSDKEFTDGLFEGLVENAFACAKVVEVKQVECSTSSTVRQEASVKLVEPARSRREGCQPTFIEDYYLMEYLPNTSSTSSQESETEPSTSQQAFENDPESRCGWYQDSPVDVLDTHVPLGSPRKNAKRDSNYPQALGKVILNGWKVRWRLYGGSDWTNARQKDRCVEVSVVGMDVHYDAFASTGLYASSLLVEIHDVHVYDYSVDARWKLILGYYHKRSRPRESTSKAVVVRMDAVRPNPLAPLEEYRLSLALLPICLHLDQAHVDFFGKFFQSDKNTDDASSSSPGANEEDAILPFFQVCEMRPLIIRVDYIPRRLDFGALRNGNCFELFNMVSWKGVELHLKSVNTSGVYGWGSLMGLLLGEWLEDIFPRQVHKLLRAFGPIRPLYAVSSGAAKLIVFPAEQYKKDKRVLRGMRKGAVAFLQSISVEALGLGANLAAGIHHILLHTEMGLGGRIPSDRKDARRKFQPSDTREGFHQAYESLAQGLERTAMSLVANPVKVYQRGGGAGEAIVNAIKGSPAAILAPASATADAVRHAFLGVRNGLDPDRKREFDEKHRGEWR